MTPREFWRLHPTEVHWIVEAKTPPKMYGSLTQNDVDELYAFAFGAHDDR